MTLADNRTIMISQRLPYESGVFLRVYSPADTLYRLRPFSHKNGIYLPTPGYVATVVAQDAENRHGIDSDLTWLYPEEVRLLATLALSVPEGHGMVPFSPGARRSLDLDLMVDLTDPVHNELIDATARELVAINTGSVPYEFHECEDSGDDFEHQLFEAIDPGDDLMIRSLYCLLKTGRLSRLREFAEEAFANAQISREGALELIREVLLAGGESNPSFRDAHNYLTTHFLFGHELAEFFAHQHKLWVATKHPGSAFGPVWMPPLLADDVFETYECLVSVFRHLLTGEHGRSTASL